VDPERLVRAAARNQAGWLFATGRAAGGEVGESGALRWVADGAGEVAVPFPAAPPAAALDTLLAWGDDRRVARIGVWASGLEDLDALSEPLLARGFAPGWRPHWMAIAAADLPRDEPDPRVEITGAVPEYDARGRALLRLTDGPFWHAVARVDGAFAGRGWSHRIGDVAGLFDVDVWPRWRRRGLGRALTLAVARAAAAPWVVLNATGEGEGLYRALGFRSVGVGRTWWWHRAA
jgi:GNAT superfamily N-acetyltransferase